MAYRTIILRSQRGEVLSLSISEKERVRTTEGQKLAAKVGVGDKVYISKRDRVPCLVTAVEDSEE